MGDTADTGGHDFAGERADAEPMSADPGTSDAGENSSMTDWSEVIWGQEKSTSAAGTPGAAGADAEGRGSANAMSLLGEYNGSGVSGSSAAGQSFESYLWDHNSPAAPGGLAFTGNVGNSSGPYSSLSSPGVPGNPMLQEGFQQAKNLCENYAVQARPGDSPLSVDKGAVKDLMAMNQMGNGAEAKCVVMGNESGKVSYFLELTDKGKTARYGRAIDEHGNQSVWAERWDSQVGAKFTYSSDYNAKSGFWSPSQNTFQNLDKGGEPFGPVFPLKSGSPLSPLTQVTEHKQSGFSVKINDPKMQAPRPEKSSGAIMNPFADSRPEKGNEGGSGQRDFTKEPRHTPESTSQEKSEKDAPEDPADYWGGKLIGAGTGFYQGILRHTRRLSEMRPDEILAGEAIFGRPGPGYVRDLATNKNIRKWIRSFHIDAPHPGADYYHFNADEGLGTFIDTGMPHPNLEAFDNPEIGQLLYKTFGNKSFLKSVAGGAAIVGVGVDAWQIYRAKPGVDTRKATGRAAGGALGGFYGGAALGLISPLAGILGGMAGGLAGGIFGEQAGEGFGSEEGQYSGELFGGIFIPTTQIPRKGRNWEEVTQ